MLTGGQSQVPSLVSLNLRLPLLKLCLRAVLLYTAIQAPSCLNDQCSKAKLQREKNKEYLLNFVQDSYLWMAYYNQLYHS